MPALGLQANTANDHVSLWQQRRNTVAQSWRDAQWLKFDRVCNEEILRLLRKNAQITQEFDTTLTNALNLLDSE